MSVQPSSLGELRAEPGSGLAYRVRLPLPAAPRTCVLLLHGIGGRETDLTELAALLEPDALVVLPRGRLELAPGRHAWFRVAFSADGPRIEASEAEMSRQVLTGFVAGLQSAHRIATRRTVIAGFSQGGIMSASVALSSPESVGAFGILAGRILPELEPHLAPPERLRSLRAFVGHGRDDTTLPVAWAERSAAWLSRLGVAHELRLYAAGHVVSAEMRADFRRWLLALPDA